ncbi:Serine/threonine-protein kinase [Cordyceps javanica]|uniref:Serine/threonine-protein kinase n=1 Tax=Cordyceps javanica TaxID=43265 RepID=A0A545VL09_9HYPO|nr:Serine/threonine-protein kinase [Cordyceps javanica]TQW02395.1 Serine/threonine-protein kinase [Cordyceps javanica]
MSWTIISVRAPAYMVEDSHNRPFQTREELPWIENDTAIDSEDGTPAPERPPPDVTLRITTRHFPKNPGLGFVFGRDRETCDILLPPVGRGISKRQFAITFRTDSGAVMLCNLSRHLTYIEDELGTRHLKDQKHIITFYAFNFCIGQQAQLIMEYAPLGSMTYQSKSRPFSYHEARDIFHQVLQALGHLHSRGTAHRDVKPDNILIMTREPMHAKLADFALASNDRQPMTVCGTERYTAPEMYRPPYTPMVDIWSVGVMVMELWFGLPDQRKTTEKSEWAEMLRTNRPKRAKPEIKELLDACLQLQPTERRSAEQCLKLAFFRMPLDAAGVTRAIDATYSASPTTVVHGPLERAPCHAIENYLPDTATYLTFGEGLPDTAPFRTEASQVRYPDPHQAQTRQCGNEEQWAHFPQPELAHQQPPQEWSFSNLVGWTPSGLDNLPVDGQGVEDTAPGQLEENDRRCLSQVQAETTQLVATGEHVNVNQGLHLSQPGLAHLQPLGEWSHFLPLATGNPLGLDRLPVDGQGVGDMPPHQLAAAGEYGNDDQGMHSSQIPEGWSSTYPPRSIRDRVDSDGQAVNDQNDANSGHGAVVRNENSLPQPVQEQYCPVSYQGTTYHFFEWRRQAITYTDTMVNLTQLLKAANSARVHDRRIRGIFRDTKQILNGGDGIRGTFIFHQQVAQVCHRLNIDMAGLPDFLMGAANNADDIIRFFNWREKQIAYFRGMVNVNHIVRAAGHPSSVFYRTRVQRLLENAVQLSGDRATAGTFIPYVKAIRLCTQLGITFDDLPAFISNS